VTHMGEKGGACDTDEREGRRMWHRWERREAHVTHMGEKGGSCDTDEREERRM
jgi:hypothetical protein